MRIEPGTAVTERLKLVRPLGRGGMGSVWVAHHEALDIEVAVKFIAPELAEARDPTILARFRREAQLAAKLDGPNVVRILDHGITSDDVPYIVMELLRGDTLAERIAAKRRLAPADVVSIVADVAEGLAHAHELGIVHRDIKPQNLFLTKGRGAGATDSRVKSREIAKILDFGIARGDAVDAKTATAAGSLVGTLPYMSPELLLEAKSPDPSADRWALAVVAYEALTGRQPFVGETPARVMMAITRGAFDRASKGGLPTSIDAFFERALAPDPAERFKSAPELAEALRTALAGASSDAASSDPSGDVPRADQELSTEAFVAEKGLGFAHTVAERTGASGGAAVVGARTPSPADSGGLMGASTGESVSGTQRLDAPRAEGGDTQVLPTPGSPGPRSTPRAMYVAGAIGLIGLGAVYWSTRDADVTASTGASSAATTTGPVASALSATDATAAVSASAEPPTVTPSVSSPVRQPPPEVLLPCPPEVRHDCHGEVTAWCDPSDRVVGCCAKGLAPIGGNLCKCPPGGTTSKESIAAGCPAGDTSRRPEEIQKVVRSNFSEFRKCYESALGRNDKLKGKLSVSLELGPDGIPGRVHLSNAGAPDPEFQECVMKRFEELRFDPPVDGHVKINYPLVFAPGE